MPQTVQIEGVGPVEFDDSATESDILEAADHLTAKPAKPSWLSRFAQASAEAQPDISVPSDLAEMPETHMDIKLPRAGFTPQAGDERPSGPMFGIPDPIAQSLSRGQSRKLGAITLNAIASGTEGLLSPETPGIMAATVAAPEVVLPLFTASMGKSAAINLAEGLEAMKQGRESEGVQKLGESATGFGFAVAPALHPGAMAPAPKPEIILPRTLEALRQTGVEVPESVVSGASPISTIGETRKSAPYQRPARRPEVLPKAQQSVLQDPAAGEYRVREDSQRPEIEAAQAKANKEIQDAWPQMTEAEKENARRGRGIPTRFGGRAPDVSEGGIPPIPTVTKPVEPAPTLPVVVPPVGQHQPIIHGAPAEQKPPETGGPDALPQPKTGELLQNVPALAGEGEQAVPAAEGAEGVRGGEQAPQRPEVSLKPDWKVIVQEPRGADPGHVQFVDPRATETSGKIIPSKDWPDFSKLPTGSYTVEEATKMLGEQAKGPPTAEDIEMARVRALPEGPEGERQLVAEDIAKAVDGINVTDIAGNSPVPDLVRLIRRTARDPAMKTTAEQAMQKIGKAAKEQGVGLDTIKAQVAEELKAIYGADAPEMAKYYFGEAPLSPRDQLYQESAAAKIKAQAEWPTQHDAIVEASGLPAKVVEDALSLPRREGATHPSDYANLPERLSRNYPGGTFTTLYNALTDEGHQGRFLWGGTADAPKIGFEPSVRGGIPDRIAVEKAFKAFSGMRRRLGMEPPVDVFGGMAEVPGIGEGPGAKTAGAPKYPAIQQLTDQLNAAEKVGKKPSQMRQLLEKIAETWAGKGDLVTKAIAKTRVGWTLAKQVGRGIRKASDIDSHLGEYDYAIQSSTAFSKQAGKAIERQMRDVTDREAAGILIDSARIATRDPARLATNPDTPATPAEVRQVIKDALDILPKDTPRNVRRAMERALDPSLELRQFAEGLKQYFGIRAEDAIDADLFEAGLKDYYTHVWGKEDNMPSSLRNAVASGRVNTYFQFSRQRKIPSLIEGILEGKKPILDPAKVVPFYNFAMDRAIASRSFVKALSDLKASDGRPAVDVRGGAVVLDPLDATANPSVLIKPKGTAQLTHDYRTINHPAMQKWKWLTKTPEGREVLMRGDLVVHPEFHTQLKRFMDRDVLTASKPTQVALAISGTAKGLKLGLIPTTFHIAHVGAHAAFHWTNPFRWAPIDFEAPLTRFAIEKGHLKLAPSPAELSMMQEGLGSSGLIRKIPYLGEWSGAISDWMFHQYIPRLKLNTFENAMNRPVFGARSKFMSTGRALKAGRLTESDVAARIGDSVNNAFGELNHLFLGKVGRDPRFQRFLQLAFLAPDFGEARGRFVLKAASRYGSEERLALITMGVGLYYSARLANYLSHGNPEKDDWRHAFEVKVKDENGKWHWVGMRSVVGDISHAIDRPGQFLYTRLNPLTSRPTTDFLYGREERTGRKLSFQERVERAAGAFVPIGLGGLTEPDRTAMESLGQSMGLANRRDMAVSDVQRKAHDWLHSIGHDPVSEIIPTDEPSYMKLRTALNIGKTAAAKTMLENLLKTRSHKEVEKAMVNYLEHPYTGSKELEKQWATTFTKKDAQQYLDAQKEKQDTLLDFYKLLGATLKNP